MVFCILPKNSNIDITIVDIRAQQFILEELDSGYTGSISVGVVSCDYLSSTHRTGCLSIKPNQHTILTEYMLQ